MIKSMTGFGRFELLEDNRKISVEMKAVNHRYLDLNIKMPKKLSVFESNARNILKAYMERGKVDVYITCEDYNESRINLKYHPDVAGKYVEYLKQMAQDFSLTYSIDAQALSKYPEVLTMEEEDADEEALWELLEKVLKRAAEQFVESRVREGEHLKGDLIEKLDQMLTYVDFIETRSPEILKEYRRKLEDKVKDLLLDTQLDEARIVTEVTVYADKICVDEETVRLKSHIKSMKETLLAGGAIGRKLDFIAQEMNREANTVLSKVSDLAITDTAINLKTDIEKVREQIQNIE